MVRLYNKKIILSCVTALILTGCSSPKQPVQYKSLAQEVSAIKAEGGFYKVGSTYTALGQRYTPKEDYNYSETGMASWYGSDFHNKRTANGEVYNMYAVTAAHRTLPLPSIVRVTNLENGKSIIARVNDRGPYVKNRIIDLSQKGAELLGYKTKGVTKVKVEIMAKESRALKEAMIASNNKAKATDAAVKYGEVKAVAQNNEPAQEKVNLALREQEIPLQTQNKPADEGTYFVQVGAFSDYQKAKQTADSMQRFGKVTIHEAYLSKDGIYRVRIGAYHSRDEALQILDRVLDYGHADVTIVEG